MLAARIALLAALAVVHAEQPAFILPRYNTVAQKSSYSHELNQVKRHYIPSLQCSADLSHLLHCDNGKPPTGVYIIAYDHVPFPNVHIDDSLRTAYIIREMPCEGVAPVTVKLACP